ncbi:HD-GYP domain-containing protein [Pseudocolwellia agarivorans]|uniref:HD-GYP domain-containing protein n=1 Tax=Pseudocolwellia agarivorans TaxID=1911682 RepID=UPI00098729F9|nr:HD-GYP domain-containing protein [Pseudocolwellia agarivorans]
MSNSDNVLEKQKKIPLNQLTLGMYVLSIFTKNKDVNIKSEGYILKESSIEQLKKSHVTYVIIDPSKTKQNDATKDSETATAEKSSIPEPKDLTTSLDKEIKTANKLYNNAKALQEKILQDITLNKIIDTNAVQESTDAIVDSIFRNPDALLCMTRLRMKDDYLVEHSLNVSILMTIFCKHLNIERKVMEQLALGAFLHDIGKVLIPDHILHKPSKLTSDEYEIMKTHVVLGVEALKETPHVSNIVMSVVKEHHERIDGKGYPNQLEAKDISLYGRMIAIVDSYDAMTAERVYKAGMHPIRAFKILMSESPNSYDKALVEQFIQCLGLYPIGTLVKLNSGKVGLISRLNKNKPLNPFVRVFYNTRLNQVITMEELDLSKPKYNDQIASCIKPEEFNLDLLKFFKNAFID